MMPRLSRSPKLAALSITVFALSAAVGCSADLSDETEASGSDISAVAGEYQARLRATTGEEVILGFDASWKADMRRPECSSLVASVLRIRLYDRTSTGPEVKANIASFVRGRTVAYHRDDATSPGAVTLRRLNAVSYGADLPDVVIDKRCSGEPLEHFQSYSFSIGERTLIDPIGNKPTFMTQLSQAGRTGVSATSSHVVDLRSTNGTTIQLAFRKLRGDDPAMPQTCERTEAVPLRIAVETPAPASSVEIELTNSWRSRTTASVPDPSAPGRKTLTKDGPNKFSLDLGPLTIDGRCSGEAKVYGQSLKVIVDGQPLVDPIGQRPSFSAALATAPAR